MNFIIYKNKNFHRLEKEENQKDLIYNIFKLLEINREESKEINNLFKKNLHNK